MGMRVFGLWVVLLAAEARADTRWGLKWKAPDECIGASELAELVEARLGIAVFGGYAADFTVEGSLHAVQGAPQHWQTRLAVVSAEGEIRWVKTVLGEGDCRSLDGVIAQAVVVGMSAVTSSVSPSRLSEDDAPLKAADDSPQRSVFLHIDSPTKEVRLYRHLGTSTGVGYTSKGAVTVTTVHLADECRAPCDRVILEAENQFFIGGDGVTPSAAFVLADHQREGRVDLHVKPGNALASFLSWFSAGFFGVGGIAAGSALLVVSRTSSWGADYVAPGVATLLGGVAVTALCVVVGVMNGTSVTFAEESSEP